MLLISGVQLFGALFLLLIAGLPQYPVRSENTGKLIIDHAWKSTWPVFELETSADAPCSSVEAPKIGGHGRVKRELIVSGKLKKADCGFTCNDGTCISSHKVCDNYINCNSAEDETNCNCKDKVGLKKQCDHIKDCVSGEDEFLCGDCSKDEFSCSEAKSSTEEKLKCIGSSKHCDGVKDCSSGRDEEDCFRLQTFDKNIRGVLAEGFLQKRIGENWYTVCRGVSAEYLVRRYVLKACESIVGEVDVDLSPKVSKLTWPVTALPAHLQNGSFAMLGDTEAKFKVLKGECLSKAIITVVCPEPKCGWPVSKYKKQTAGTGRRKRDTYDDPDDTLTPKIVGGYDSEQGDWPFLVGIYRNGTFHCGGSIVHKQWILAAAHCFHNQDKYVYEVQAGMTRRFSFSPHEQTRQVLFIYSHEKYDSKIFLNDISLVKLDRELYLSKWVAPACLAPKDKTLDPKPTQLCSVLGWGDISETIRGPDHMQEVELPVLEKCQETFTKDTLQICAGVVEGGKDACQGDSGGPFACQDDFGRRVVCGVVSFGRGCARPNQPGVYTRVSAYIQWIDSVVSGENQLVRKQLLPLSCGDKKCIRSGGECLFHKMLCDRKVDCLNAMDEADCKYEGLTLEEDLGIDERAYAEVETAHHGTQEHIHDIGNSKLCGPTEFQCKSTKSCVPQSAICNGKHECSDSSDEKSCDCGTIISNAFPRKKCDGILDCADGSDEEDCIYCNGEKNEVKCPLSDKCIPVSKWCDGMRHCSDGEDEVDCVRLVRNKGKEVPEGFLSDKLSRGLQKGYVFLRSVGTKWNPACVEDMGDSAEDVVCSYLGYALPGTTPASTWTRNTRTARVYIPRTLPVAQGRTNENDENDVPVVEGRSRNCTNVKIACGEPNCGERRLYSYSRRNPTGDAQGAQPWFMTVMVEGQPTCPATLVHKQWLVASTKCIENHIRSLTYQYVSAMSGYSEKTHIVSSPLEQVKRVNAIEKDSSPLSLLHLDSPFMTDHLAAPICTKFGKDLLLQDLKGAECTRIYFDENQIYDDKAEFDPENSVQGKYFSTMDAIGCGKTDDSFVYCSTDGTAWFFLGYIDKVDQAKDECIRNGFIRLANPLYGIWENKTQIVLANAPSTSASPPTCSGVRCSVGNCVDRKNVCDGIAQCSNAADEQRCHRHFLAFKSAADEELDNYSSVTESSNSSNQKNSCALGHFQCKSTGNCVPFSVYCDGNHDCGEDDFSDEPIDESDCTCRHYLALSSPDTICDSTITCPDRGDELGCPCQKLSFNCNNTSSSDKECVLPEMVCDGVADCTNGFDEADCIRLSSSVLLLKVNTSLEGLEGFVLVRRKGTWHPYCSNGWSREMGVKICQKLLVPKLDHLETIELTEYKQKLLLEEGLDDAEIENTEERIELLVAHNVEESEKRVIDLEEASLEDNIEWASCKIGYLKCSFDRD